MQLVPDHVMTTPARNDVSVRLDADVYRKVRTVAAWHGITIAEYISQKLDPVASADLDAIHEASAKDQAKKPKR